MTKKFLLENTRLIRYVWTKDEQMCIAGTLISGSWFYYDEQMCTVGILISGSWFYYNTEWGFDSDSDSR